MHVEKALDLQRYGSPDIFNYAAFRNDLARFTRESDRSKPLADRLTFHSYTRLDKGWIIDARLGTKHVKEYFRFDTPQHAKESNAGLEMANILEDHPEGTLAIWISPLKSSSKYDEGRLDISLKRSGEEYGIGISFTESYGIVSKLQPEEHFLLGCRLAEHAEGHYELNSSNDLRQTVFIIYPLPGINPWERLQDIFPDEDIWEVIKSGQAIQETLKAEEAAQKAHDAIAPFIANATCEYDYVVAGAIAEQEMARQGYQATSGPCGETNSDLLKYISTLQSPTIIDQNGEIKYWVNYCGKCCATVKEWIKEGYTCKSCGGVYRR
jgi:hypothetical protein